MCWAQIAEGFRKVILLYVPRSPRTAQSSGECRPPNAPSAYHEPMTVHELGQQSLSEQVAAEVRALMGRFNLLQADLADALGVDQTQVSRRLRGHTPFTLGDVERLADYFQTTPLVLLGYMTEPRPKSPNGAQIGTARETRTLNWMMTQRLCTY